MSIFAITYRLDWDTEARYDACYKQLNAAIQAETTSVYWAEPTSFYLIESSDTSADIADRIVSASPKFDKSKDVLLVINLSVTKGSAVRGKLRDTDYTVLMSRR